MIKCNVIYREGVCDMDGGVTKSSACLMGV